MEDTKDLWNLSIFDLNLEVESWERKNKTTMIKLKEMKEDLEEITYIEDIIMKKLSD